jgi:hypothetical protein
MPSICGRGRDNSGAVSLRPGRAAAPSAKA